MRSRTQVRRAALLMTRTANLLASHLEIPRSRCGPGRVESRQLHYSAVLFTWRLFYYRRSATMRGQRIR